MVKPRLGLRLAGVPHLALVFLTSLDYHETMNGVRVADLKSRLSEHLRKVRAGRSVTVLDRNTPIARIVPYEEGGAALAIRPPLPGASSLKQISMPPPLKLHRDVVAFLLEERQGER
jgi:prevent-host-death family protein